jgi:Holliday junction resolvase RusA-like endonuclease
MSAETRYDLIAFFKLVAEVEIPGRPQPQQRHRQGGKFLYDPSAKYKASLAPLLRAAMKSRAPLPGPVAVEIVGAFDKIKRRKPGLASGQEKTVVRLYQIESDGWADSAPEDADNVAKLILDAANGIWWTDDRQVVSLEIQKISTERG